MLFEIPEGNAQYDEWARECGYLILAFGQIESLINQLERSVLGVRVNVDPENASRPRPRLDLLIEEAEARRNQAYWGDIAKLLHEFQKLSRTRNLIAHNGLSVEPIKDGEGNSKLIVNIRSTKKLSSGTRIDFIKLKEYRSQALELHRKLFLVVMPALMQLGIDQYEADDSDEEEAP